MFSVLAFPTPFDMLRETGWSRQPKKDERDTTVPCRWSKKDFWEKRQLTGDYKTVFLATCQRSSRTTNSSVAIWGLQRGGACVCDIWWLCLWWPPVVCGGPETTCPDHLTMASLLFSHVKTSRDMWHSIVPSNRKKETIQIPQNPSVSHRWGWWAYRCQRWARSVQPSRVHPHTAPRAPWARPDRTRRPPAREECYRDHDTAVLAESITA